MSNDSKKIAFSFSKVKKPSLIQKVDAEPKEKKEYVDCFDGSKGKFSYKGCYRNDSPEKVDLVIPMPIGRTSADIVRSRIEEKMRNLEPNSTNNVEEKKPEATTDSSSQPKNIEELAALELLNEIKNGSAEKKKTDNLIIETKDLPQEPSETDIDYDNVPVNDFGLAMLRGMGWRPDQGIGKEPRVVETLSPKLRLKGLGLGAQLSADELKEKEEIEKKDRKEKRERIFKEKRGRH